MSPRLRQLAPTMVRSSMQLADAIVPAVTLLLLARIYAPEVAIRPYVALALVSGFASELVFTISGLYVDWSSAPRHHHSRQLLGAWAVVAVSLLLLGYAAKISAVFSRVVVFGWLVMTPILLVAIHLVFISTLWAWQRTDRGCLTAVVVGHGHSSSRLIALLQNDREIGIRLHGYFDDKQWEAQTTAEYLGFIENVPAFVKGRHIDRVYVTLSLNDETELENLLLGLHDLPCRVFLAPNLFVFGLLDTRIESMRGIPLMALGETAVSSGALGKRIVDLALSAALVVLSSPLQIAIALAIKTTSRGPVLFRQWRYGIDGAPIKVYKFRTMTTCEDGPQWSQARRNDPRVTRLGKFLRRSSLDELPQLFNVFQGRLSLVGPRPHPVALNEQFRQLIPEYMLRHKVKPGITGWAQVHGLRGETDTVEKMQRRVEYDLYYIRHWSLVFDLHILARTVVAIIKSGSAY